MARFSGKVGYGISTEVEVDVYSDVITERAYKGQYVRESQTQIQADKVNNDLRMEERISIVADAWGTENWTRIKYVEVAGSFWTVTSVEVERPRLILSLGGVYSGPRAPQGAQSDPEDGSG